MLLAGLPAPLRIRARTRGGLTWGPSGWSVYSDVEQPAMAGSRDWYRKTTWTNDDAEDFFAHLERSRADTNRAQYLKIQARTLKEAGDVQAALDLLDIAIEKFPNRETAQIRLLRAECLWALGLHDEALDAYRSAFQAQREQRNIHCNVALSFAEAFHDVDNGLYRVELLDLLREEVAELGAFPFQLLEFRYSLTFARLLAGVGEMRRAAKWAERALAAKRAETSALPHHSALAVANAVEEQTEIWLRQIAAWGDE